MKVENVVLDKKCNVVLTAYILDDEGEHAVYRRPAVIVMPGGGYKFCSDQEGEPVALAFAGAGYHAFVLRYSVGDNFKSGKPIEDYEAAYENILSHAESWHIMPDKIAVAGFSAGGHLAACAATISNHTPQAAILGYAVTLKGDSARVGMGKYVPAEHVSARTCPTFLFATATDAVVPVKNTIEYAGRLSENGVPFECHIYSQGEHGFSLGTQNFVRYGTGLCPRAGNWLSDCISWLNEIFGVSAVRNPEWRP